MFPGKRACCLFGECNSVGTQDNCIAIGGTYLGDGTGPCVPDPCVDPIGACCLPNGSCSEDTQDSCKANGGAYLGDGIACKPDPCP